MLVLGGGNLELGRRKFDERMHVQKEAKLSKVNDVSLLLEEEFAAWLATPKAESYSVPMVDSSSSGIRAISVTLRLRTSTSMSRIMPELLILFGSCPSIPRQTLIVYDTLAWDEKVPFSKPLTFPTITSWYCPTVVALDRTIKSRFLDMSTKTERRILFLRRHPMLIDCSQRGSKSLSLGTRR